MRSPARSRTPRIKAGRPHRKAQRSGGMARLSWCPSQQCAGRDGRASGSLGVQFPKQWLLRPISIAAASCLRVTDGFDKTAETASHFVGAFSRSPAHPVNISANRRIMILIRAIYPYLPPLRGLSRVCRLQGASGIYAVDFATFVRSSVGLLPIDLSIFRSVDFHRVV
jgi:hypothetical protein